MTFHSSIIVQVEPMSLAEFRRRACGEHRRAGLSVWDAGAPIQSKPEPARVSTLIDQTNIGSSPGWPIGLTWDQALLYTGLSATILRQAERAGAICFRKVGRNGSKLAQRGELDLLVKQQLSSRPNDIAEDFDFGDD